jgi:hypothetical protein
MVNLYKKTETFCPSTPPIPVRTFMVDADYQVLFAQIEEIRIYGYKQLSL